jgi:hypothetical protein
VIVSHHLLTALERTKAQKYKKPLWMSSLLVLKSSVCFSFLDFTVLVATFFVYWIITCCFPWMTNERIGIKNDKFITISNRNCMAFSVINFSLLSLFFFRNSNWTLFQSILWYHPFAASNVQMVKHRLDVMNEMLSFLYLLRYPAFAIGTTSKW